MKNLRTFLLCACMTVCGLYASAQNESVPINEPNPNKPKLFAALPDVVPVNITSLAEVLNAETGSTVNIAITSAFRFQGEVVSTAIKYGNSIRSIVIRSVNYTGARLTFSKVTAEDGTVSYVGRIVSMDHGDLYELQNQNGQYSFIKKKFYDLINE